VEEPLMLNLFGEPGAFNEWRLVFLGPWGRAFALAAVGLALATLVLTYRSYRREPRRGRRLLLTGLRAGALAAALLLLAQPAIQLRHVTRIPNHVAVLVDDSRSMGLAETAGGPTRADRMAALLRRSREALATLARDHRLDFYRFGTTLTPISEEEALRPPAPPRSPATRLREALQALRGRHAGRELAGAIVLSDGADNGLFGAGGLDPAARDFVRSLDVPVHTVWTGRRPLHDVAVAGVRSDDFAFVHVAVSIDAILKVEGYAGHELTVHLRRDGELVRSRTVPVPSASATLTVPFEFTPDRLGKFVYTVETPVLTGEAVRENNVHHFVLNVIRDKVRVLLVCGRPSFDERFLRGMLKRDPNVDLISFFILRTPTDITMVPPDELSLIPFPTDELFEQELKSFDLVILQNFNFAPYGIGPHLGRIRRYVEEGGALAMIGGDLSFTSGGYAGTPVAEVLPVELLPYQSDAARLISVDSFRPRLTPAGRSHPITAIKLDVTENEARLAALPPLEGVNQVGPARPGATVLLTHPFLVARDGRPMPVLAVAEVGKGRSLALTTDTTWHWSFLAAGESGAARQAGDDGRTYVKFWDNAIRWLIRDPALRYLRVDPERNELEQGQPVRLTARTWLQDYRPARDVSVALEVRAVATRAAAPPLPGAAPPPAPASAPARGAPTAPVFSSAARTDADGQLQVDVTPPEPGAYRVTARATLGGRPLVDETVFTVVSAGRELGEPGARDETLKAVARASGGRFLDEPSTLPDLEVHPPQVVRIGRHRDVELWSRPWVLLFAIACLAGEWLLRRRYGFV
jgi:uncharacterized membrane protein